MFGPLAILFILLILFALYGNFKFPVSVVIGVVMTEPVGALIALKLTHTPFSVSSVLGLLALMGVSVETAVILVSYINKLRLENHDIRSATREAALLRLRPIMMTALVACLGLLPAALSTGIGSDTQRPFASEVADLIPHRHDNVSERICPLCHPPLLGQRLAPLKLPLLMDLSWAISPVRSVTAFSPGLKRTSSRAPPSA